MSKRNDVPSRYDEIVRKSVPTLDLFRPTTPPESPGERELEARVRDALRADSRLASAAIDVLIHGSQIWLTGIVIGPGTAAYAEDIAKGIAGVTDVHNELRSPPLD